MATKRSTIRCRCAWFATNRLGIGSHAPAGPPGGALLTVRGPICVAATAIKRVHFIAHRESGLGDTCPTARLGEFTQEFTRNNLPSSPVSRRRDYLHGQPKNHARAGEGQVDFSSCHRLPLEPRMPKKNRVQHGDTSILLCCRTLSRWDMPLMRTPPKPRACCISFCAFSNVGLHGPFAASTGRFSTMLKLFRQPHGPSPPGAGWKCWSRYGTRWAVITSASSGLTEPPCSGTTRSTLDGLSAEEAAIWPVKPLRPRPA